MICSMLSDEILLLYKDKLISLVPTALADMLYKVYEGFYYK